ncbi:hypothetical protein ZIOFF_038590 [Zingiber officinale]|uniref:Protein kinase domain-containing protein n=1 Tax=Zingiber officinale TaxID=94328 RepID=A0A8J5G1Q2_ZINOF|nr:hypothetical protein ZIOFF_038590 [Zingiber officinale]
MGVCYGKNVSVLEDGDAGNRSHGKGGQVAGSPAHSTPARKSRTGATTPSHSLTSTAPSAWPSPYPHGPASPLPAGVSPSPTRSTPRRFLRPFPPPSPAKHIRAALVKRLGPRRPKEGPIPEDETGQEEAPLDKNFGYGKNFGAKYELGKEVGRGHFGHTCSATVKRGEIKGQIVAVKIISKAKMTTPISIEDVRREVTILKALSSHKNLVKFHDACEDALNVYVVMEGGRYTEEDAKAIVIQILRVVAFCHLQGVVHRDLKPENFLFANKDENSQMKLIDFGLSDFVKPGEHCLLTCLIESAYFLINSVALNMKIFCYFVVVAFLVIFLPFSLKISKRMGLVSASALSFALHPSSCPTFGWVLMIETKDTETDERLNDIVGSAYYVAPEVLHRSYSTEADIWSIGIITYILLCGSRPFWARTESGIFRAVLKADPNFTDLPWPDVSPEAKDFVKRLLNKDYRKRMTAAQSLSKFPPLGILILFAYGALE